LVAELCGELHGEESVRGWKDVDLVLHDATRALAAGVVSKWCELGGIAQKRVQKA
jgi:hypothetical protein